MSVKRWTAAGLALVTLLSSTACVFSLGGRGDSSDRDSRYQFTTDRDGNTIKLDRRTGVTWILQKDDASHTWRRLSDPTSD
ncbi:MAG: hypothetical protein U1E76_06525 [Planctomycetota bacterium]